MFHFHHPRHRAAPTPAHIYALDIHIRYYRNRRRHTLATVTLTWTAPTTRTDGSPLAADALAGTHIFSGTRAQPTPSPPGRCPPASTASP